MRVSCKMNYKRIYDELMVSRATLRPSTVDYYEKHHVLPKSLGGTNDKNNVVNLTAREHYLAHWLLTKIHPKCPKMWTAFALMSGRLSPRASRKFSDKAYERCKKAQSIATKIRLAEGWHPGKSPKCRKKAKDRMNSDKNPIKEDPSKNWTARPVKVYFADGSVKEFSYGKIAAKTLGIPYSTWKWVLKNNNGMSKKYKIVKVVQAEPKPSNNKFANCEG